MLARTSADAQPVSAVASVATTLAATLPSERALAMKAFASSEASSLPGRERVRQRLEVVERVVDVAQGVEANEARGQQRGGAVAPEAVVALRAGDQHIGNRAGVGHAQDVRRQVVTRSGAAGRIMHGDQVPGHLRKADDVVFQFALRVGHDQAVPGQHPVADDRQNHALRLTGPRRTERQNAARRVFAAQVKRAGAVIQPPFVLAPERAQEAHAFPVLAAVAAVFAHRAEMRRSQRATPDRRAAQPVHPLAQPPTLPQPVVQDDVRHTHHHTPHQSGHEQPCAVNGRAVRR